MPRAKRISKMKHYKLRAKAGWPKPKKIGKVKVFDVTQKKK